MSPKSAEILSRVDELLELAVACRAVLHAGHAEKALDLQRQFVAKMKEIGELCPEALPLMAKVAEEQIPKTLN